jgi:hypothetical protein
MSPFLRPRSEIGNHAHPPWLMARHTRFRSRPFSAAEGFPRADDPRVLSAWTWRVQFASAGSFLVVLLLLSVFVAASLTVGSTGSYSVSFWSSDSALGRETRMIASSPASLTVAIASPSVVAGFVGPRCSGSAPVGHCGAYRVGVAAPMNSSYSWVNLTTISGRAPQARYDAAMAYDSAVGEYILNGGCSTSVCTSPLGDTWGYTYFHWTNLTPHPANTTNAPSPRFGSAMSDNPGLGGALLFGGASTVYEGSGAPVFNDSWGYSGTGWSRICRSCGPDPRYDSAIAYSPTFQSTLMFGGTTIAHGVAPEALGDTWVFHSGVWSQVTPLCGARLEPSCPSSIPAPRASATLTFDPGTGRLLLFGGASVVASSGGGYSGSLNDAWAFTFSSPSAGNWSKLSAPSPPSPRWGASAGAAPQFPGTMLFGGCGSRGCPSAPTTWEFNGNWTPLFSGGTSSPSARYFATSGTNEGNGSTILFGGKSPSSLGDTWAFPAPFTPLAVATPTATPAQIDVTQTTILQVTLRGSFPPFTIDHWNGLPPGCFSQTVETSQNSSGLSCTPTTPGTFSITVVVSDSKGQFTTSPPLSLAVGNVLVIHASATPQVAVPPAEVAFSANISGGVGKIGRNWTLQTNSASPFYSNAPAFSFRFSNLGSYSVELRVNDATGATRWSNVSVFMVEPMTVSLTASPTMLVLGQSTLFLNVSVTGGVQGAAGSSFSWSGLPPGCPGQNSSIVRCVPSTAGLYSIQVTVVNPLTTIVSIPVLVQIVLSSPHPFWTPVTAAAVSGGVAAGLITLAAITIRRKQKINRRASYAKPAVGAGVAQDRNLTGEVDITALEPQMATNTKGPDPPLRRI